MSSISSTGFSLTRLSERLALLYAAVRDIFGVNVNVDPNSVDGETLGIVGESLNNLDQLAQAVYQSFNPDTATGLALSRLVRLNGITRNLGSYGQVTLTCTGNQGTFIPAGSLVNARDQSSTWQTTVDGTIDATGVLYLDAVCTVIGPVAAPAGILTRIGSPAYSWQTVTNVDDAIPGTAQETDEALRERRTGSVATAAQGIVEAIYGAIDNVTGVTDLQVYENYGDTVDANGLTPHSIYCVVLGGANQDIFEAIWLKKSAGVTLLGAVVGTITDSFGNLHVIKFDRPVVDLIYVSMTITRKAAWPSNGVQLLQTALVDWASVNQRTGNAVILSELYTPLNTVPGISVSNLTIGLAPYPTGTVDLNTLFNHLARFDASRITINLV